MEGIQNNYSERVPSSCSSRTRYLFNDPKISPRVGDEYQVELPPLMTKDELLNFKENPLHLGLPIPVVWVLSSNRGPANSDAVVHIPGLVDSESSKMSHIAVENEDANGKVETLRGPTLNGTEENAGGSMEIDSGPPLDQGYLPVPGLLSGEGWEEIEHDSFVLGLYIFGKNLYLVKKFVGSKGMGEILLYYHGTFYKSSEYNKWLEFRRKRKKRRPNGEKIFTSWRLQELISCLSPHVSKECKTRLIEASRIFGAGKMSVEKYMLALKEMVGLKLLVQTISIGKGKRDLISSPMEHHAKTNASFPACPETPCAKPCSSLTVDEIVKFLTGNIRLSKSRSNDLFWDAVWPRLEERGWRTEETRNYISLSSKQPWVYLIPGVKKISRRKLVKGTHYFDSVSDILNKVASEPNLLEVDEGSGPGPQEEHHSNLQPLVSQDQRKFTIVDTSLVCEKETEKVIELRTLPSDPPVPISTPPAAFEGIERNIVRESDDSPSCEASVVLDAHSIYGPDPMMSDTDKHEDQNQPRMPMEIKCNQTVQSSLLNEADPTTNSIKGGSEETEKCIAVKKIQEIWIDLNLPRTPPPDSDKNEPLLKKTAERSQQPEEQVNPSGVVVNGQRHSTRNRPLTTKALEAFACGYLSPKKKRKCREAMPKPPPRQVRGKTALLTSCGISGGDEAGLHKMEKGDDGVHH